MQVRNNKVVYLLRFRDLAGNEYDILDTPVTIIEENTYNKKYTAMMMMFDNQIAIQLSDGLNSYYQYIDLKTLWNAKPTYLKSYGYPTSLANGSIQAVLYDDGTGYQFTGKLNTPVTVKSQNFWEIDGKNTDNYLGGYSSLCNSTSTSNSTTIEASQIINDLTSKINKNNSDTNFESWGATPTLNQYNALSGVNVSFLVDGFGDAWFEKSTNWENYGYSNVTVSPIPTSNSISGALHFTDYETSINFIDGQAIESSKTTSKSQKLEYVSNGVFTLYDDTNKTAQEEIKFVKEFTGTELNNLFTDSDITFDTTNDKAAMIVTKALTTYYEWNEIQQNWDWNSTTPTTYNYLTDFITAHSGTAYFTSKNNYDNIGIAFGNNGLLVEVTNTGSSTTTKNAGTWSISDDDILDLNITVDGYDYTPAFTLKNGVVWRGEKRLKDNLQAGILFNSTALEKVKTLVIGTNGDI